MDEKKIEKFVLQLSRNTLDNKIHWQRASDYEHIEAKSNPEVYKMLFQCEFRHIDFMASYFGTITNGAVFILDETNESGRDGTVTHGYKMYIQDDTNNKIIQLPCASYILYQLINSIQVYISNEEKDAEEFIDSYLSSSENSEQ